MLEIVRILIGILFIALWVFELFSTQAAIFVAVPIIITVLFVFANRIQKFYDRLELRFVGNLNARETVTYNSLSANVSRKNAALQSSLSPWDAHIIQMDVAPEADYIGRTLAELAWREKYGINVVYVKRGEKIFHTPGRQTILLPYDQVGVIATDEQIRDFKKVFDSIVRDDDPPVDVNDIALEKLVVNEHTRLKGKDIRNSGLRERTNGLVIGIERDNQRILNPASTTVFEWNDVVWIVGDRKKIQELAKDE